MAVRKRAKRFEFAPKPRWYVIANRTEAVFYAEGDDHKFHFIQRLSNPKGQRTETELDSDKPGRGSSSAGDGTIRHLLDGGSHKHEEVARKFAHRIADALAEAYNDHRYDGLVLAAEPRFLGMLRKALPLTVQRTVNHEVPREFRQGSDQELRAHLLGAIGA